MEGDLAGQNLKVRHPARGHEFTVEGEEALPPSAQPTSEPNTYDITEAVDCPICNPPSDNPDL